MKKKRKILFIACMLTVSVFATRPVWGYEEDETTLSENDAEAVMEEVSDGMDEMISEGLTLSDFVKRMYTVVLEREAEEGGLAYWTQLLEEQSASGASLASGFICSPEFTGKNLSNEKYIDILYRAFLGREADAEGRQYWLNCLSQGASRTEVLSGFVNSKEFSGLCMEYGIARGTLEKDGSCVYNAGVRAFVLRLYNEVLERAGDTEGIEYWCYVINTGDLSATDCARNFLYSREFLDKNVSHAQYIDILYRTFLDREADAEGKNYWIAKLLEGMTRDDILRGFADSREFRKILAKYGIQVCVTNLSSDLRIQPFASAGLGDCSFRIPSMVSLDDGTVVAAADARWDALYDGGGFDTIAAVSHDYGNSWKCSFANYLGDNGNCYSPYSTSFLDPALATDGSTVYMLVNFYPAGYSFYGTSNYFTRNGVAFDKQGRLLLKNKETGVGDYYLENGFIYQNNGRKVDGYTVDSHFNIKGGGISSNLFCLDQSPFGVYPTQYLYFTKSSDGGNTWSAPMLLNVKREGELGYSVGCGTGTVLSDGTIVFCCYSTINTYQLASFIYSRDGGNTWSRSDMTTVYGGSSSEASVIELNPKLLRMFYRDSGNVISYIDYNLSDGRWKIGKRGTLGGIQKTANNRFHVMRYDEETLLVSTAASGTDERKSGVIATVKIDKNYQMKVSDLCYVNGEDYFGYSCLVKLKDGSVGLMYESFVNERKYEILYRRINRQDL